MPRSLNLDRAFITYVPPRLLLFAAVWRVQQSDEKIQFEQNAAACLIIGTRRCERITPVAQKLHWLPVRRRVEFKLLSCLVNQSLAGQTLTIWLLTFSLLPILAALNFGDRNFYASGPRVWNASPSYLQHEL